MEVVVNLTLDVSDQIDVAYDQDLESFLAAIRDHSKYEAMIRVEKPLIEEESGV